MTSTKESIQLIVRSLRRFLSLSLLFAIMILVVRLYELLIVSVFSNYPPGSFVSMLIGFAYDVFAYLQLSAILMIPFLLIAYFSQKSARLFFISVSSLIILGYILLIKYFSTARIPLGADLFGYSIAEIKQTVASSGEISIFPMIVMVLFMVYVVRVMVKHVYFKLKPWFVATLTGLMLFSLLPIKQLKPNPSKFDNEFSMFAAESKLGFFTRSVANHYLKGASSDKETYTFATTSTAKDGNPFTYIDQNYPFLHKEETPDVLASYFDSTGTPPNFVFIVVESLGRAYSGQNAYLGSYTPFLDSLMQKSLYWENCLSTSGRTFQVLPSMLASLPFGDKGFTELGDKMPEHVSLISLLKKQAGYNSSFVYGGEAEFDQMDAFLKRQGVDMIIDSRKFGDEYKKLPSSAEGFSWGYGDHEIFSRFIQELKTDSGKPRIDVILTLAMHSPFTVHNQEDFERKVNERTDALGLTEKIKAFNQQYVKELATVMYFDESLRYFFNEVSKTASFANTIFVITGDHRMPEIPISTQIDRFHVPLVIYSPMLKKPEKFSSVVTHFDVAPSLIALLNGQKVVKRPSVASWIGHGLDNSVDFRNLQTHPLMRNKSEILDLVSAEQFLSGQTVYQVSPNMDIEPLDDDQLSKDLQSELKNFILKNNFAVKNNKLIPDSLSSYYK